MHRRGIWNLIAIVSLLTPLSPEAEAEYRVFQLVITDTTTGQSRTAISNLDDIQYPSYHHLRRTETIAIQDSWMCWQRSDHFQAYCPNPKAQARIPAQDPAAPSTSSSAPSSSPNSKP